MSSFDNAPAYVPPLLMTLHMCGVVACTAMATLRLPPSLRQLRALPLMRLLVASILVAS